MWQAGVCLHDPILILHSATLNGSISISLSKEGESMSVLLVGQDHLKRRVLRGPYEQKVSSWFFAVEEKAWRWVNATTTTKRPDNIFLVTGQTLASEYAISHVESLSAACSISVEAKVSVPGVADVNFLLGNDVVTISASTGFEVVNREARENEDPRLFSLFLEVVESGPMKALRTRRISRVRKAFV